MMELHLHNTMQFFLASSGPDVVVFDFTSTYASRLWPSKASERRQLRSDHGHIRQSRRGRNGRAFVAEWDGDFDDGKRAMFFRETGSDPTPMEEGVYSRIGEVLMEYML